MQQLHNVIDSAVENIENSHPALNQFFESGIVHPRISPCHIFKSSDVILDIDSSAVLQYFIRYFATTFAHTNPVLRPIFLLNYPKE